MKVYPNLDSIKIFLSRNFANILLFCILLNASKIFFENTFYIRGILVDYLLPRVYLSQVVIFFMLLPFLKKVFLKLRFEILILFVFLFVNILFSKNILFSLAYLQTRFIFIFVLFVLFILPRQKLSYKLIVFLNLLYIFIFLFQFFTRSSFFSYFPFGFYMYEGIGPNLDFMNFFGQKLVVPLGNFPHPNVFAAFLSFMNVFHLKNKNVLFLLNLILIVGLGSFSAVFFNLLLVVLVIKSTRYLTLVGLLMFFAILFYVWFGLSFKPISLIARWEQLATFFYLIKNYPTFGVGLGNFISSIPLFENHVGRIFSLQPIHNIFLLFVSEFGIYGSLPLIYFFSRFKKYFYFSPFFLFLAIFGFTDHFLITLNQGLIMLTLTIYLHKFII